MENPFGPIIGLLHAVSFACAIWAALGTVVWWIAA